MGRKRSRHQKRFCGKLELLATGYMPLQRSVVSQLKLCMMGGPTNLNISDKWMIAGVPCEMHREPC